MSATAETPREHPRTPPPTLSAIPKELKERSQWVLWKWEQDKAGRWTKVPYQPNDRKASTTKRATWASFDEAAAAYARGGFDGIGFVFAADDPYTGVDLDKCRDLETGTIEGSARGWIKSFGTYAETSPSGTGVHLIGRGRVPEGRKTDEGEVYCEGRFFTVTGDHLEGTPWAVEPAHDAIEAFWRHLTERQGKKPNGNGAATVDVAWDEWAEPEQIRDKLEALIENSDKFRQSWEHRRADLGDQSNSSYDQSLVNIAAAAGWTDTELALLIRAHLEPRGSDKWKRADYVERTIRAARVWLAEAKAREGFNGFGYDNGVYTGRDGAAGAGAAADGGGDDTGESDVQELHRRCSRFRCEDVGNAERFCARFGGYVHWCSTMGWFVWDGRRWLRDERAAVVGLAKRAARAIYAEAKIVEGEADEALRVAEAAKAAAADGGDEDAVADFQAKAEKADKLQKRADALRAWAKVSCNSGRIAATLDLTKPAVAIMPDDLDADPWLLNALNCTVDLRTGEWHPHRREDLLTRITNVPYESDATCERFLKFLLEILKDDEDLVRFVHRAVGYSITGRIDEHVMMICHGGGANGKTTLMEVLADAFGDYCQQTPSETFLAKDRTGNIPNDVARLKGARFVSASETEQGRYLAESLVKQATGGDRMAARFLRKEFFEFRPQLKLWLSTNHRPEIRGTDDGMWRRIRLIPFRVQFVDEADLATRPEARRKDPKLLDALRKELPGILAWAVRGCVEWQRHGLGEAAAVREATRDYRAEMDRLGEFIADLCVVGAAYSKKASDLYRAYGDWCEAQGVEGFERMTQTAFGRALGEKGFRKEKVGLVVYRGIDLKEDWQEILKDATGEREREPGEGE